MEWLVKIKREAAGSVLQVSAGKIGSDIFICLDGVHRRISFGWDKERADSGSDASSRRCRGRVCEKIVCYKYKRQCDEKSNKIQ